MTALLSAVTRIVNRNVTYRKFLKIPTSPSLVLLRHSRMNNDWEYSEKLSKFNALVVRQLNTKKNIEESHG
jgi:hypothetical protein